MFVFAPAACRFMLSTGSEEALSSAVGYLRTVSLFYIFCFTGNSFAGLFDGTDRPLYTFIGASSHITFRAIVSWIWISRCGLTGVAVATGLGWAAVNCFWTMLYRRGNTRIILLWKPRHKNRNPI